MLDEDTQIEYEDEEEFTLNEAEGPATSPETFDEEPETFDDLEAPETLDEEPETIDDTPKTNEVPGEPEKQPKKKREPRKEPVELSREPGKSLFPISRVQKIIKADKDIPIVAKEATLLIALATEGFIQRICEASYHVAYREKRSTVQHKDLATAVRKAEEFMFLEEIISWTVPEAPAPKRQKTKATGPALKAEATMLDQFVGNSKKKAATNPESGEEDGDDDVVMNEDGTMYAAGVAEDDDDDES